MGDHSADLEGLARRVAELEALVARLEPELAARGSDAGNDGARGQLDSANPEPLGRRSMLGGLGRGALGAAAGGLAVLIARADPVAAAAPLEGDATASVPGITGRTAIASATPRAGVEATSSVGFSPAMRASTTTAGNALEASSTGGIGVLARSSGGLGKAAVRAEYLGSSTAAAAGEFQGGVSAAIRAINGGPSGGSAFTMIVGNNARDNEPPGTFAGGAMFSTSSADTVFAQSSSPRVGAAGVHAEGFEQSHALVAVAFELGSGAQLTGGRCDLQLGADSSLAKAPAARRHDSGHARGELVLDAATGDLFLCVGAASAGQVGTWRKLAGPATAGAFHPISPTRVYDSRLEPRGRLAPAEGTRVTRVADAIDLGTGAVKTPNIVPTGATAIAYNLTIAETSGAGFLSVYPASEATFAASSMNWDRADQLLANAAIVQISATREVKTSIGGGGATHFIIDVTGFFL